MPNTKQAAKRLRQSKKQNLHNRSVKSEIRTYTRKFLEAVAEGNATAANELVKTTQAKLDKAAKKGVMHANTVGRRKSLLHRKLATIKS
ncbi:MAG: 30S ribosomal protein S20 [Planctomycetota bacterium]